MALPQQKLREIIFQLIYSHDFAQNSDEDMTAFLQPILEISKSSVRLAQERREQVLGKKEEIDQLIKEASISYEFDRIPRVERNILRLGVFEMLFDEAIPAKVAIAEAVRMSRKYATAEGATFVNGVLDAIYHRFAEQKLVNIEVT